MTLGAGSLFMVVSPWRRGVLRGRADLARGCPRLADVFVALGRGLAGPHSPLKGLLFKLRIGLLHQPLPVAFGLGGDADHVQPDAAFLPVLGAVAGRRTG